MSDVAIDAGWIGRSVDGTVTAGAADAAITRVVIDSRSVASGDLFVAIRGPRFDGHDFVADAVRDGASAVMVERTEGSRARAAAGAAAVIEVADTLKGLQDLAHAIRKAAGTMVIAITGSAGKTTTKEAIAALLETKFRVVKNKGNLNNHIGLPLSLVELRTGPDVAVMELGMNHAGEISTLVGIAEPEVRVWTNVGDAHIGFFESAEAIADAKAEILERADARTLLVCNQDDPRIMARVGGFAGRTVTFGSAPGATVRASDIEDLGLDGMAARVTTPAGVRVIRTPLIGRGNLSNVLAATAVSLELGVPLDDIVSAAAALRPADRRGAVRQLRDGVRLVDDSYNSSPAALRVSLEAIAHDARAVRRIAVLGEMLELGAHALALHRESGRRAARAGISLLVVVGGEPARALGEGAVEGGLPRSAVRWFETSREAAEPVLSAIEPGDLVLVKGSRGTRMDVVADRIVAELA